MKKLILRFIMTVFLTFLLTGCGPFITTKEETIITKSIGDFAELEPSDSLEYKATIVEYMYYKTQAIINNDINILWEKYPDLKGNIDLEKGINTEKQEVENINDSLEVYGESKILDANYDIEDYESLKVKEINEEEVVVLVHGFLSYFGEKFEESGGEYLTEIYLKRNGGKWTVVKTDDYNLEEYHEWMKGQEQE